MGTFRPEEILFHWLVKPLFKGVFDPLQPYRFLSPFLYVELRLGLSQVMRGVVSLFGIFP